MCVIKVPIVLLLVDVGVRGVGVEGLISNSSMYPLFCVPFEKEFRVDSETI